ncbi:hypothetical protein CQ054_22665 [Ochrobactrum sp. MYb29]|nr:hypothetical protein CQ054_22665 [Ochrobactrum sp. MYb29]
MGIRGLPNLNSGGDAAAYATHEFRYNYLTSQQLDKAIDTRKKIAQCQQTLRCERAEIDRLISLDREYVERSASNTRTLIETCQKAAQGAACQQGMKDAMSYGKRLEHEYQSGGASWEGAAGFSNKNSIYDYDLLLYRSLVEAQATGKQPDAAIRDFLTDFAKQEGRVGSLLDALGVVGGAAVCASGAGTPACVAGILAAISSANHLSADAQKAVTGQEARTVLVAALVDRLDYTKEQAEKLQFYIDIGVIAVTVGAGGYKIAVDAKRLAKTDQALVKLNTSGTNNGSLLWGSWNDYPKVTIGSRDYAQIGGRNYSRHAVDRMQPSGLGTPAGADGPGRNVTPHMVEDVINGGSVRTTTVNGVPRAIYTSGNVSVVTEDAGRTIVTILRNSSP